MKTQRLTAVMLLSAIVLLPLTAHAQEAGNGLARHHVKQGNKKFRSNDYSAAEVDFRKALEKNGQNAQALFNLGVALQAQQQDTTAIKYYEQAAKAETNPLRRSQCFHNLGTILQGRKMFGEAIEQYKQALRLNPADNDARYNLALCKKQLKNNPSQQDKQDKQNKKDDKQQQQKDQQDKQDKQDDKQQQQQQQPQMSKENAEQLLNAAMQEEKRTQQRMKEAERRPQRRNTEKNW